MDKVIVVNPTLVGVMGILCLVFGFMAMLTATIHYFGNYIILGMAGGCLFSGGLYLIEHMDRMLIE